MHIYYQFLSHVQTLKHYFYIFHNLNLTKFTNLNLQTLH